MYATNALLLVIAALYFIPFCGYINKHGQSDK